MTMIGYGLATGNPFAYILIFMVLYPPIVIIAFGIIEWIKSKRK